jgi:transposase
VGREFSAAAAMLGLPGFVVLAVSEVEGELEQAIETTADLVGCPECGAVAQLHDRRPTWVRDLPSGGRPVMLVWVKRVWRCVHAVCPKRTWSPNQRGDRPAGVVDPAARVEICRRVGQDTASVAAVARESGIGWHTAMTAVRDYGTPRVDDPTRLDGVQAIGVDETAFQAASATRSTSFVTGIVEVHPGTWPGPAARRSGGPVGRSPGQLGQRAPPSLASRDRWRRAGPYRGHASALRSVLGSAVGVLDAVHVVRLGFAAVDQVRCRIQREQTGHRGRTGDPLYRIRRLLRRGADYHTERSSARLLTGLDAGDTPDEQLARTWIAAQELRLIFRCPDRARAEQALYRWLTYCADSTIPELIRLATTIDSWRSELLAYFTTGGISNGPTQAINLLIKKIKRVGHGFRNFGNYRLRLLLHCCVDWDTIQATPIRGRLPRSVAYKPRFQSCVLDSLSLARYTAAFMELYGIRQLLRRESDYAQRSSF